MAIQNENKEFTQACAVAIVMQDDSVTSSAQRIKEQAIEFLREQYKRIVGTAYPYRTVPTALKNLGGQYQATVQSFLQLLFRINHLRRSIEALEKQRLKKKIRHSFDYMIEDVHKELLCKEEEEKGILEVIHEIATEILALPSEARDSF